MGRDIGRIEGTHLTNLNGELYDADTTITQFCGGSKEGMKVQISQGIGRYIQLTVRETRELAVILLAWIVEQTAEKGE